MTNDEAMKALGWALTAQGYVKGPWRIYCAETWCVALGSRLAEHNFKSETEAAGWVDGVCEAGMKR